MCNDVLYADYELDSNDMFVITPEGNYVNFPAQSYDDTHGPEVIIDTKSHKQYTVVFDE